jgi:hypothetical protein
MGARRLTFITLSVSVFQCVADPECLSWIPDPDFYPSRIPDPKRATKERGEKNKIEHYFIFEMLEKIWANFQRIIIDLFTQKIVIKLSKIWVWDPGSGKNLFWIPNPGIKKAPDPGSTTLLCLCRDRKAVEEYAPGFQADPGNLEDVKRFLIYYFLSTRRLANTVSSTTSFLKKFCIFFLFTCSV